MISLPAIESLTQPKPDMQSMSVPQQDITMWLASPEVGTTDPRVVAFDMTPMPALIIGEHGQIVACNMAAAALLEVPADSLVGRSCWEMLAPRQADTRREHTDPFFLRVGGAQRPVLVRDVPLIGGAGMPSSLLLIEPERRPGSEAEPKEHPLILDVAHELRSPLHAFNLAIGGLVGAPQEVSEPDRQRLVSALQRSSVHLQTLVENLLDAASLGASQFSLIPDTIDLSTVIRESVLIMDPLLGPRNQRIIVELPDEPLVVHGDAQRLRQVLVNLLHNAIKYGPPDDKIKVRARRKRGEIIIRVTDRGPGIPEDEQARIFDRYYRGGAASAVGHGNGLGLSIARASILAHGGTIGVRNESKIGTTFWFTLRIKK
jgi:signal transduction histidine kinase